MIFQSKISKVICFWILCISIALSVLIINQGLQGINIYRFGPNPDLYILGFCINTYEKYISVAVFCFINSGMRTLNNEILKPWITNQVQDVSKPVNVLKINAYEITCVSCLYIWFDFFMYMNILLAQIDMMLIEVGTDLITTTILTTYYLHKS